MSENLDLIRSAYSRFNAGEKVPPDDLWHADSEYVNSADDPDPAVHRGLEAVRKQFERWVDTYPDFRAEPVEFLANADRVFVWAHFTGTAALSGAPVEMQMAQVWTVDDGKIRRCEEYFDRAEALEAAGLSESLMSHQNVEIVRRVNAAVNAGKTEEWVAYLDPEFEFVDHMAAVAEESGSGIEAVRRLFEGWLETFPDFHVGTEQFIDAGDRVVTVTHWQGTGAGSGLPYSQRAAEIFTLRDGKVVHLEMGFADKAAALEAVGLSA